MSYIGNTPFTAAFQTDTFSGNGTTTAFTMSVAPANTTSIIVAVTGVVQDPSTYSVSGTTLTFSAAPPTGTSNISVRFLGIPASGVTTTAYRTVTDTTATAGQTTFSIPSYTVGYLNVYRNGSRLAASDYTATSGTSVVLANAASAGDTITTESFYVSSVLNAFPTTGGTLSGQLTVNSATGQKPLIAQVNGTEVFEIDSSGNVGIGTASPTKPLEVYNTTESTVWARTTTGYSLLRAGGTGGDFYFGIDNSTGAGFGQGNYSRLLYSTGAYPMVFSTNATERMRIDSSGNVGIGTSSPAAKLQVLDATAPTIQLSDGSGRNIKLSSGTASTSPSLGTYYASDFLFYTNSVERMRIDSSGNLLVGTTSGNFHRFFKDSASDFAFQTANTSATTPYVQVQTFTAAAPNNATSMFLRCDDTGLTGRIQLRSNGGIANFSANNVNLSDRRAKTNFAPAKSYLDTICAIPVQTFNFIDQNMEEDGGLTLGVVAQDVQAVAPELVMESNWGTEEEPKMRLSIYQTDLQYALMKCIQEQQALITQLQADVAALKGNA